MTKKILIGFLVLIGIGIVTYAYQNNPKVILSKINQSALDSPQNELRYKMYLFGVFPVGSAVLEDRGLEKFEKSTFYHLTARAQAQGLINQLYPFSFNIDSYLDQKTFLPVIFKQLLKTKDKESFKEARYNQPRNIMQIGDQRRSILPETYEPLSAVYKLRHTDLEKFPDFDLNINTNQKNYAFKGSTSQNSILLNNKPIGIFKLNAKIFRRDKNLYHQSRVNIIFLNNPQKTPLFIKVFASGFLKTVRLVDAK